MRSNVFNAFGTETSETFEVGLKSQFFNRKLTFNAAGFINTIKNLQTNLQSGLPLNPAQGDSFNNPAKNVIKGFELEMTVHVAKGLTVSGNYTYLDTAPYYLGITTSNLAPFSPTGITVNSAGALIPSAADLAAYAGKALIFAQYNLVGAPKNAGGISLDYKAPVGEANFVFHTDWVLSSIYSSTPSTAVTTVSAAGVVRPAPTHNPGGGTNRVNVRFGIADIPLGGTKGEIMFWGKNIFDHVDYAYSFGAGNGLSPAQNIAQSAVFLQAPRTYGVDFRVKF